MDLVETCCSFTFLLFSFAFFFFLQKGSLCLFSTGHPPISQTKIFSKEKKALKLAENSHRMYEGVRSATTPTVTQTQSILEAPQPGRAPMNYEPLNARPALARRTYARKKASVYIPTAPPADGTPSFGRSRMCGRRFVGLICLRCKERKRKMKFIATAN